MRACVAWVHKCSADRVKLLSPRNMWHVGWDGWGLVLAPGGWGDQGGCRRACNGMSCRSVGYPESIRWEYLDKLEVHGASSHCSGLALG